MSSNDLTPDSERTQAATADQEVASASLSASSTPAGYQLLAEVGRGGMGIVFRARDLTLEREVAVKLLQDQFSAGSQTAARFLDEARITAQLQHPGIPAVHQVGFLANGRPFLAMKLIQGDTLDHRLKQRADITSSRSHFLDAFEKIAQAMAYAHSRRIIHRDLKPANIMVGAFGEVQVMDWGLAKERTADAEGTADVVKPSGDLHSTVPQPPSETNGTQYGQFMGTPAYMPPEQAIGAIDQIDERSDVFGLGAILCTILTGKPPFHGGDAETTRQLAARGKVEDAFLRLDSCGADPDVIGLAKRCLSVERDARPTNADEVATAVAKLRTAAEKRSKKLELDRVAGAARWRIASRAAVLLIGVLGAGIAASVWQAVRATTAEQETSAQLILTREAESKERMAREEADQQRALAEAQKAIAQQHQAEAEKQKGNAEKQRDEAKRQQKSAEAVRNFLANMISQASPWDQLSNDVPVNPNLTLKEALDRSAKDIAVKFQDEPALEEALRLTIGGAYNDLGLFTAAEPHLKRSLELATTRLGGDEADFLYLVLSLGDVYRKQGKFGEAEPLYHRCIAKREKLLGKNYTITLEAVRRLAYLRSDEGRHAEAEVLYRRVATGLEKALGLEDTNTLESLNGLANCLLSQDKNDHARDIFLRVIPAWEEESGPNYPQTLFAVNGLALAYQAMGQYDRAEPLFVRTVKGLADTLGTDHHETLVAKQNLGNFYRSKGDLKRAEVVSVEVLEARERIFGPAHYQTMYACNQLALTRQAKGEPDRAEPLYRRAIEGLRKALGPTHPETVHCMNNLAEMYRFMGRYADADPLYQAALDGTEERYGPKAFLTLRAVNNLGTQREGQGRYPEAEKLFRRSITGFQAVVGPDHLETLMSQYNLAYVLADQNRYADAEPLLEQVAARRAAVLGDENASTQDAVNALVIAYEEQGKYARAEPALRKLLAYRERTQPMAWTTANTRSRLGRALLAVNRIKEAEPLLLKSFEELKAKEEDIPFFIRGLRMREAAVRVVSFYEAQSLAANVKKWQAVAAEYRELAPPARVKE